MKNITEKRKCAESSFWHASLKFICVALSMLLLTNVVQAADGRDNDKTVANKLSLNIANKSIGEALDVIQEQSGYIFFFYDGYVNSSEKVNLNSKDLSINQTLDKVFENTNNEYEIDGRQVFVRQKAAPITVAAPQADDKLTITGSVLDDQGIPVIGASIAVPGSSLGTVTDVDGKFTLKGVSENTTLTVSFIGYISEKVVAKSGKTTFQIRLKENIQEMEEIVVIGYGTERRSLVTSAISKMKMEDASLRQAASPTQLLDGRVAGVNVSTTSGNLGSAERMSIRGASSLNAGTEPLYVIDGVPITNENANLYSMGESMSSLASINLTDIESMEILKDAASAAIYGSRGTNGVVVITTKSGKEGRSDVKVNFSTGFSKFPSVGKVKMANSELYLMEYNEGADNYNKQNGLGPTDANYASHMRNPFGDMPDTNWMDVILQTGSFYNIDGSFSGGNKKTKIYIGANYTDQEGIIKTNKLRKLNLKAKLSHEMNSWLEVGANTSGNYMKNYQVPGAGSGTTIINRAIIQRPFDRPYKPNGDYYVGGTDELVFHNPVQVLNEQNAYFESLRFLGSFYSLVKFRKNLTWRMSFNTDITQGYDYTYFNENHPYGTGTGRILDRNRTIKNNLMENVISYNEKLKEFSLSAMVGHSFQKVKHNTTNIDARGFPSPSFDVVTVASEISAATANVSNYAMESYFGRATLAYKDRYIFTGTLRTDGSSKFAKDKRWGWFPSVSLGWNVSEEDFMKDLDTEVKFRMSYGQTGNQEGIGRYSYQSLLAGGRNYGGESGIAISSFGNKELTWEKAGQYDIGVDVSFLKGKINTMIDVYQKKTTDLLYSMPMHATSGRTSMLANIGEMKNTGIEFTLNTHFNIGKVEWLTQFNISHNQNKLTKLLDNDNRPLSIGSNRALQVGKSLGAFYIFEQQGIYQYDGEVPRPQYDLGVRAGDVKWTDVDGDGIINDNDRVVKGNSTPKFYGGLNNTFRYSGFQLDVFFSYMYGNDVFAQWQNNMSKLSHRVGKLKEQIDHRWTGPGTSNKYPRSIQGGDTNNVKNSDRTLEDGSFIRLRSLTFAYNVPQKWISKYHIKGLRAFFQGDNLFILTKYSGWDPEVSDNLSTEKYGVDTFGVPQPRTYSFGVNVTF